MRITRVGAGRYNGWEDGRKRNLTVASGETVEVSQECGERLLASFSGDWRQEDAPPPLPPVVEPPVVAAQQNTMAPPPARRRGRPPGSKNRPKG